MTLSTLSPDAAVHYQACGLDPHACGTCRAIEKELTGGVVR